MSSESMDYCRLCLTTKNLFSMFGGKSRTIRNSLRKMIQETVNVQVEQNDSVPSVCFNCLVDISNFHYFRIHCLQNQKKLEDVMSTLPPKPKKYKLSSEPLDKLESPDINSTEEVLKWLASKRIHVLESQTLPTGDKASQTICEITEVSSQCDTVPHTSKSSQTNIISNNEWTNTTEEISDITHKKDTLDAFTQCERAEVHLNVVESITAHTESSSKNKKSAKHARKRTRNQYSQTSNKVYNLKNSYSQTKPKTLCQKLFLNSVIHEISTQDHCIQTEMPELIDKDFQCDLVHSLEGKVNQHLSEGNPADLLYKICVSTHSENNPSNLSNKIAQTDSPKLASVSTQSENNPADFSNKISQTDTPKMSSLSTQCELFDILNEFYCKELCLFSPTTGLCSKNEDSKLIKEEKLSPVETLTISTTFRKNDLSSPSSSDLLQVKPNKSHCVKICKICDKSLYNRREIVVHNKTHMQCHFCKKRFRSLKITQNHINHYMLQIINLNRRLNIGKESGLIQHGF